MKKKTVHTKKASARKTVRKRTTRRAAEQTFLLPFTFRRIVLVTTAIALFLVVVALFKQDSGRQAVAGVSIMNGLFSQATVTLPKIDGAVSYNIYYKEQSETDFPNAVTLISTTLPTYTVTYLNKGTRYEYKVTALDASGKEFWFSEVKPLETTSM